MLACTASMDERMAMYNANALKIGVFGANCSSGRSATTVPERWSASWPDCLRLARVADAAGIDFMLPIARWKGYGGETDFQYGDRPESRYRPTKVDRVLHDGDQVRLGNTVLVAHLTPGHTKGCTTWTMKVAEQGKTYEVVIIGSPNVNPGYKLVDNKAYPQISEDYERMWRILKSLSCDIFLGAHGNYFGLEEKYPLMKEGGANPFVDPEGYKKFIAQKEQDFRTELAKQRLAAR